MTRKDYVLIAGALKTSRPDVDSTDPFEVTREQTWRDTANKLADVLQAENPRFNRVVFAKASGIDPA